MALRKKGNKKRTVVRQPYDYSKQFLQNRITPSENRIFLKILERIKTLQHIGRPPPKNLFDTRDFYFDAKDLVVHNDVDRLEAVLTRLGSRRFLLRSFREGEESIISYATLTGFERKIKDIGTNQGKVWIELHEHLYQYFLKLSGGYTEFISETAFELSNSYSIKIYYHIRHWLSRYEAENSDQKLQERKQTQPLGNILARQFKCKTYFSLEVFKKEFDAPATYAFYDIRRRILEPSKKELDEKSEVSFNYAPKYEGRKVIGISFVFYRNVSREEFPKSTKFNLTVVEQDFVNSIVHGYGIESTKEKARLAGIVKKYGRELVVFILSNKSYEIERYKERGEDLLTALGIICAGELNNGKEEIKK